MNRNTTLLVIIPSIIIWAVLSIFVFTNYTDEHDKNPMQNLHHSLGFYPSYEYDYDRDYEYTYEEPDPITSTAILEGINAERKAQGLPYLKTNTGLSYLAKKINKEMVEDLEMSYDYFDIENLRQENGGYSHSRFYYLYRYNYYDNESLAGSAVNSDYADTTFLSKDYEDIGIHVSEPNDYLLNTPTEGKRRQIYTSSLVVIIIGMPYDI